MSAFSEGAREIMQEGVGAGMGGGAPSVAQQPGEPLRVSRGFARATEGSGQIGQLDQSVTVTLEGGEQIQVDQSNVESKLDNIERAIKNIDSDVTVKEQDLARGVTSAEKTFTQRRDRDDN
jgi:septal ring factor EnvC (AmiA/AmiB activator)